MMEAIQSCRGNHTIFDHTIIRKTCVSGEQRVVRKRIIITLHFFRLHGSQDNMFEEHDSQSSPIDSRDASADSAFLRGTIQEVEEAYGRITAPREASSIDFQSARHRAASFNSKPKHKSPW